MNSIRILLSLATNLEWPLHQFDVKNAFLHGDLEEEVYMDVPLRFEDILRRSLDSNPGSNRRSTPC